MMENKINAGEFSNWIEGFTQSMKGPGEGNVPCGECVGCCTSFKFIHIRPTDKSALKVISKELMFQAPGLPEGHYILGYDQEGNCPMFKSGKCSIYESRPETCRQYDCRVFAASKLKVSDVSEEIAKKVKSWEFEYSSARSIELSNAVKSAGIFLSEYADKFPTGFIPSQSSQLAVMAVRIHPLFLEHTLDTMKENYRHLVDAILKECTKVG